MKEKEDKKRRKNVKKIGRKMKWNEVDRWVKRYQDEHSPKTSTYGWLYGCDTIEEMLKNKGCEGIWFFKGINDEGKERLVLYPADKDGKIMGKPFKSLGARGGGDPDSYPVDDGDNCPPDCP